jgi:hypothetical protein
LNHHHHNYRKNNRKKAMSDDWTAEHSDATPLLDDFDTHAYDEFHEWPRL